MESEERGPLKKQHVRLKYDEPLRRRSRTGTLETDTGWQHNEKARIWPMREETATGNAGYVRGPHSHQQWVPVQVWRCHFQEVWHGQQVLSEGTRSLRWSRTRCWVTTEFVQCTRHMREGTRISSEHLSTCSQCPPICIHQHMRICPDISTSNIAPRSFIDFMSIRIRVTWHLTFYFSPGSFQ